MSNRALVTGGAGFIGSHLVDRLIEEGREVTVLDDFSSGNRSNLDDARARGNVDIVEGSILQPEAVADAMSDCSHVFHLAVQCVRRSLGRPMHNHEINATGTLNVLEAARMHGISRFVYCSSSEVYGNASDELLAEDRIICEPVTVYGAAKLAGEYYTKAYSRTYDMPVVIVRPFNSYGPREHDQGDLAEVIPRFVIRALNDLPPIIFGNGENGRDFTYVTETARGIYMAADCDRLLGKVVNIAHGQMITIGQVAQSVASICQRGHLQPVYLPGRPGDVYRLRADIRRATDVLEYNAEIEFEQGLEKYIAWFLETYPDPSDLLEDDPINWQMPEQAR